MRLQYDKSSKWLIQHHADAILHLGGVGQIKSWRALQAELVQPRKLPDGLLEVEFFGQSGKHLFLLEISTYPENRVAFDLVEDLFHVYLDRGVLPEVLTLVLYPRGNVRIADRATLRSPLGWSELQASWRVVELWTLPADALLAADDPGLVPWIPLTQFAGSVEPILRQCRDIIDRKADPGEWEALQVVTHMLASLRYNKAELFPILGGREMLLETPLMQEILAEARHKDLIRILEARFGPVPPNVAAAIKGVWDEGKLTELITTSVLCENLEGFRKKLVS